MRQRRYDAKTQRRNDVASGNDAMTQGRNGLNIKLLGPGGPLLSSYYKVNTRMTKLSQRLLQAPRNSWKPRKLPEGSPKLLEAALLEILPQPS